mmetsp:Transcript_1884/g.4061  ORF Transcript_1884/g.4061 Transcript_1884/m.4061 type:complete len:701 (+) Transcript_1884:51-2153(+)
MFRSIGKPSDGNRHATSLETDRPAVEEDYGDSEAPSSGAMKDPEYWRVRLPTDELDDLMWGSTGMPPPAPPVLDSPKYQKNWAGPEKGEASDNVGSDECRGEADISEAEHEKNDNILSALEISGKDQQLPPIPDKILLEDIVWKQRSGFGKYSFGVLQHEWEQRRVVLFESGMLRYYALKKDMEGGKYDPSHATDPSKSPWVHDANQEPRGEMHLNSTDNSDDIGGIEPSSSSFDFGAGMRRMSGLVHEKGPNVGGATVHARERQGDPGPTPFEIDVTKKDNNEMWRFCFQSQSIQIQWLSMLKSVASDEGDDGDDVNAVSEGLANHGFQPGDHIIRWEMLPVLYPIQIHGIVLEAGKNCVIIADFGLASYDNRRAAGDEGLTTWSGDEGKDDSNDVIMAAWEKIKPKEKKRLNVIVVTDPKEVRKWSKINYVDQVEKDKKPGFFTSFLPGKSKHTHKKDDAITKSDDGKEENECADDDEVDSTTDDDGNPIQRIELAKNDAADQLDADKSNHIEGAPEWFQPGFKPRKQTESLSSAIPLTNDGQSVFSIDRPDDDHSKNELPKTDSSKLVLARTHFILENEDLLPPYHVFYSNSECIAVWCKTGRWSTLQAAVYLVSSSVGFGKSATMLTLSVAAAHMILIPALAVGGLAVIGAPLLFLKRSQEQWDKATMHLTEKFWMKAEPEVFVEAIEYWARLGKS